MPSIEEQAAKQRLDYIAKRQELLESAVNAMQYALYEAVLVQLNKIADDPAVLDALWRKFNQQEHLKVITRFSQDIFSIGKQNDVYFKAIFEGEIPKDYAVIKKEADIYLLERFGLTPKGEPVPEGFIDSFVKDTRIKQELKQYAYKAQTSGVGLEKFKQGFKEIIAPIQEKGTLQRFYSDFAYDTYQQVDATIQDFYSRKLDLQAAFYLGGIIEGTRVFCRLRNGRVFIRSEIQKFGSPNDTYGGYTNKSEGKFTGKNEPYDPFEDRGGANCRHGYAFLTNKQALRRREDLEEVDGKLRVKN